jgi:putative Holliday junction resolvase
VKPRTRLLAIDPGTVRLGLAISDSERRIASPLTTYTRRDLKQDADYLKKVIEDEEVGVIVIGLPVRADGYEGEQAQAARKFGAWLHELTGVPCVYYDERYTSFEADTAMLGAGLTKQKRKERRDRVAAQILLQAFLEAGCPMDCQLNAMDQNGT